MKSDVKCILTDEQLLRYSRQILLPDWDIDAQLKLLNARVLMIGMGGLGCPATAALARAGVGYLRIVDADVVDESNLQRQTLFERAHIGLPKVLAVKQQLMQITPWLDVDAQQCAASSDNLTELLQDIDLVLDGSDNFATRDAVNRACVQQRIPLISAAAIGLEGQLTMILPDAACYRCLFPYTEQDADTVPRCAESGVLASTTQMIGNLQAHAALLYLGLGQSPLAAKLLLWDGEAMTQRQMTYRKDMDCPVCGGLVL